MILMVRVGEDAGAAIASPATEIAIKAAIEAKEAEMRMLFLPIMVVISLQVPKSTVEPRSVLHFARLGFFITPTHVGEEIYQKGTPWLL